MITYDLTKADGPLYICLYNHIKNDITSGKFKPNYKMPSKRALANNLGVSTITVENAYDQLIGEGYVYSISKKGYYVAEIADIKKGKNTVETFPKIKKQIEKTNLAFDFSSNHTESNDFPFSVWAKLLRETLSTREKELLTLAPCSGVEELRTAIAFHLSSFRGLSVSSEQVVVGAGTEYLYEILIKLLGKKSRYCIESPGYKKLMRIYNDNNIFCGFAGMDDKGIIVSDLRENNAQIAHISPTHHFPTGITMSVSRRYELLAWANEANNRYIIEDEYDSEFRLDGKPVSPLMSMDTCEKVIYMNTFSKSLTATIRISYMVLPVHLAERYYKKLGHYSSTVSNFEQYTLASFISRGYFEKHINRMRIHYKNKRARVLETIRSIFSEKECQIVENDSGLHFLLKFNTKKSDKKIKEMLLKKNIRITAITDYDMKLDNKNKHLFILNYSNINLDNMKKAILEVKKCL